MRCSSRLSIVAALVILASGCASDALHIAQFDTGMTRAEVEEVQGPADKVETSGDYTALRYGTNFWVILYKDSVIGFGEGTIAKYPGTDRYFINQTTP